MCFRKKILYQYFVVFFAHAWEIFTSEEISHPFFLVLAALKVKENTNHPLLFKLGERSNRHPIS